MSGALLIATISNGMNVVNISSYWQPLVIGLIILAGVGFDSARTSTKNKSKKGRSAIITTKIKGLVGKASTREGKK
jgi:ribose transport system permease protein